VSHRLLLHTPIDSTQVVADMEVRDRLFGQIEPEIVDLFARARQARSFRANDYKLRPTDVFEHDSTV
jgi:hypothetical protein